MPESQLSLCVLVHGFDDLVGTATSRYLAFEALSGAACRLALPLDEQVFHLQAELSVQCLARVIVLDVNDETLRFTPAQLEESR